MATLQSLADRMENLKTSLPQLASLISIGVSEHILFALVRKTPVDTSKALSNWQIAIGDITNGERGPFFPGKRGSTYLSSGNVAYELGKEWLRNKQPGQVVYIYNCVDYILDLNEGTSRQAPAGFVYEQVQSGRIHLSQWKTWVKDVENGR